MSRMPPQSPRDGGIRLLKQILLALVIWLGALTVSNLGLAGDGHGSLTRALLAVLGIAGVLPWLYVTAKSILAQDEFTQRVHLVALAWAFAATALLSLSADLLQKAGFLHQLSFGTAWAAMIVFWAVSLFATSRYYR